MGFDHFLLSESGRLRFSTSGSNGQRGSALSLAAVELHHIILPSRKRPNSFDYAIRGGIEEMAPEERQTGLSLRPLSGVYAQLQPVG